jgi:hypothetical protein
LIWREPLSTLAVHIAAPVFHGEKKANGPTASQTRTPRDISFSSDGSRLAINLGENRLSNDVAQSMTHWPKLVRKYGMECNAQKVAEPVDEQENE